MSGDKIVEKTLFRRFIAHAKHEWRTVVFVAALVAAIHSHFGWLDGVDATAFFAIGGIASTAQGESKKQSEALVVLIDQTAHETDYLERSPLNRCRLLESLEVIYKAMADVNKQRVAEGVFVDVLVVDLDISPALLLANVDPVGNEEHVCEQALYRLIKSYSRRCLLPADSPESVRPIRTVLMEPFPFKGTDASLRRERWIQEMACADIKFGKPTLPLDHGMLIKHYCDPDSLAGYAQRLLEPTQATCVTEALHDRKHTLQKYKRQHIDPRKYFDAVMVVGLKEMPGSAEPQSESFETRFRSALGAHGVAASRAAGRTDFKAVFFGAGYGQDDLFKTPVGWIYGVEAHAGAFLSMLKPQRILNYIAALVVDIVFGFIFGFLVSAYWRRYFLAKVCDNENEKIAAPKFLFPIFLYFCGALIILPVASWVLFRYFGIWSSPIPIAIGMAIEGIVSGPVEKACELLDEKAKESRELVSTVIAIPGGQPPQQFQNMTGWARTVTVGQWIFLIGVVAAALYPH